MPSPKVIEMPALGRPFTLGMLYDAREEKPIPGLSLWDDKTIAENTVKTPKPYSQFKISASDSLEEKSNLLDVKASIKASFLSGLVSVEGSAQYLNDSKKFMNQCRVTLQYKATTTLSELALTSAEAKIQGNIDHMTNQATHVVTRIEYGANAFFVFDSERVKSTEVQDIQGKMEAAIKKIPKLEVEASVDAKLSNQEKKFRDSFSCKFYGDFLFEKNPTTFDEAVNVYKQLSHKLEKNVTQAVAVKVWLTPLNTFDPKINQEIHDICDGLLNKIQCALEDLKETEMRCRDSLAETVVGKLSQVKDKLERFERLCDFYTESLKNKIKEKIPLIRAGKEKASSVEKLFDQNESFSYTKLSSWIGDKEAEIAAIKSCVDEEGAKILSDHSDLKREILVSGAEHTLCFVFTSLESADPYLDELDRHLHQHETQNPRSVAASKQNPWYLSSQVISTMREKAQTFQEMAKALDKSSKFNFLVMAKEDSKYKGATIYHYKGIDLVTEDFSKPGITNVEEVKHKGDLIWYARDLTLNPDTANGYLTLSENNKKATCDAWQTYPDHPDRFDKHTQVLCREELSDRCYWEVEWNECNYYNNVGVAVVYKGIGRKGNGKESELGSNTVSWYFGQYKELRAYHNGHVWSSPFPPTGCRRVGVFLDHPGGTLTFYKVVSDTLEHLYTFKVRFTQPVYPGFYIYESANFAYLCPVA